jgi:hypothetical protein
MKPTGQHNSSEFDKKEHHKSQHVLFIAETKYKLHEHEPFDLPWQLGLFLRLGSGDQHEHIRYVHLHHSRHLHDTTNFVETNVGSDKYVLA